MKPITPQEVLHIKAKGDWYYQGRKLNEGEIRNLKSEADLIAKTSLWKLLINEGKYHAQARAIISVKTEAELKQVQEFHKVLVLFEEFIHNISSK